MPITIDGTPTPHPPTPRVAGIPPPPGRVRAGMGLLLVVLGLVLWLLVSPLLGLILIIVGILLLFVPGVPYGYGSWRRGPPP